MLVGTVHPPNIRRYVWRFIRRRRRRRGWYVDCVELHPRERLLGKFDRQISSLLLVDEIIPTTNRYYLPIGRALGSLLRSSTLTLSLLHETPVGRPRFWLASTSTRLIPQGNTQQNSLGHIISRHSSHPSSSALSTFVLTPVTIFLTLLPRRAVRPNFHFKSLGTTVLSSSTGL